MARTAQQPTQDQNPDAPPADASAEAAADPAVGGGSSPPPADSSAGPGAGGAGDQGASGGDPGGERSPAPQPAAPQVREDWRDRRIAQLTAQLKSERERSAAAGSGATGGATGAAGSGGTAAPAVSDQNLIERRAQELAAQQEFLRNCDEMQQAGRGTFGQLEFDTRTNSLRQLVDVNNPVEANQWNSLLVAARETGEGARLLYELGANLNDAQRLLGLPPVRMAVELAKLASKLPQQQDGAEGAGGLAAGAPRAGNPAPLPNPVRPVGGRGSSHQAIEPDDTERGGNLDMATWMARRSAQVKARGLR